MTCDNTIKKYHLIKSINTKDKKMAPSKRHIKLLVKKSKKLNNRLSRLQALNETTTKKIKMLKERLEGFQVMHKATIYNKNSSTKAVII